MPAASGLCPFCRRHTSVVRETRRPAAATVQTINLEAGLPTVDEALARLDRELAAARGRATRVVRVIHGWGSSGTGGAIRQAVRSHLRAAASRRQVRGSLAGDDYSDATDEGRRLLDQCPSLRASLRTDRRNPGITFVMLSS